MDTPKTLSPFTKILSAISAVALFLVIFLPIWRIELTAPQYPEGLTMQIFSNRLSGDVKIINQLNHYIGMRELHANDFVEFTVLPYILGFFALFGLFVILLNRRWFFSLWAVLFVLFAVASMVDFYLWEQNYGSNLDPQAPIQVPGMTYSPPLIGFKQLLNFGAYSIPDQGGWVLVLVGLMMVLGMYKEFYKSKNTAGKPVKVAALLFSPLFLLSSCSTEPQPISFGVDNCAYCVMTLVDENFGTELVTKKGKAYKFDDAHCLAAFLEEGTVPSSEIDEIYFIDYSNPGEFIPAPKARLLQSEEINSPMGSNIAVFSDPDSTAKYKELFNAKEIKWNDYIQN